MAEIDAGKSNFSLALLFGNIVLFREDKVDPNTVPEGVYLYELSYSGFNYRTPTRLGKWADENFYGTVISRNEIKLYKPKENGNAHRRLKSKDDFYVSYNICNLTSYLHDEQYEGSPTKNKKDREER